MEATTRIATAAQGWLQDEVQGLPDQDLIDALHDQEAARRRLDAENALTLVELSARATAGHGGFTQAAVAELGLMMGVSTRSAQYRIDAADAVVSRPQVWDGLHRGDIDKTQAQKIVVLLAEIPDPQREELEAIALEYATEHTTAQLHKKLLALTCDHDPDQTLRKQAVDKRGVEIIKGAHGMDTIVIYTSAEQAEAFMQSLDSRATRPDVADPYSQGDERTPTQKRADVLHGFLDDHCLYSINVNVLIPADMLIGVETTGANLNGSPCTHALATHLAWSPDARWTRLVTDPLTGILMDVGRTTYEIPKPLRDAVRLRDVTCRFPMCERKAEYCDTDHVIPHRISNHTEPSGLQPGCRGHHRGKTFGQWTLTTDTTFAMDTTWTGAFGISYTTRPPNQYRRD